MHFSRLPDFLRVRNQANEQMRLEYRYLDLRRPSLAQNIKRRSEAAHTIRAVFHEEGENKPLVVCMTDS